MQNRRQTDRFGIQRLPLRAGGRAAIVGLESQRPVGRNRAAGEVMPVRPRRSESSVGCGSVGYRRVGRAER